MSGEDFLKFNKNGELRFSSFKEIKEDDLKGFDEKAKKLFSVFAGDDKILQAIEAQSLWNALMSVAKEYESGKGDFFDGKEIQLFSKKYINEEIDVNTFEQLINYIFGSKNKSTDTTIQKTELKKYISDNGSEIEDVITYDSEDKPIKLLRKENGKEISTTEFNYKEETDEIFAHVKLVTKNADGSTVVTTALDADEHGQVAANKLIDRTTTDNAGNITKVYSENGYIVEQKQNIDGKEVLTIYKGPGIEDYDQNSLNRAFQQTISKNGKINVVEYDERGNTKTIVQNGESLELIAQKFGIKLADLKDINPKLVKRTLQVGEDILIPGEFNADSYPIRTRKTKGEAIQSYNNFAVKESIKRIYASNISERQLDKNYANMYDLAKDLLTEQGNNTLTKEQINDYANELILLNKDAKLTKGAKIKYTSSHADEKTIRILSEAGFLPNEENQIFYSKFNALDQYQKNYVLNVVKYCKSKNITDPNKIKATIMQIYPAINMFDSGKIVNTTAIGQSYTSSNSQRTQNKQIPVEMFITDILKLDLDSGVGRQVYSRLVQLPQSELDKISADDFLGLENPTFNQIADKCGLVNIRTENELKILQNGPKHKQKMFRQTAAENVALAYDKAIEVIKNYQGNLGLLNVGYYREKLGSLLSKINPTDVATCFDDVVKRLEQERDFAVSYLKSKSGNEAEFKKTFKEITGIEYNEKNIQNFIDIASKEGADWSEAYNRAYGDKAVENATKKVNFQSYVDGAGDIVLMLLGTEAIGKGVAQVGGKVGSKLTPYFPKTLSNVGNTTVLKIGANPVTIAKITGAMATSSATFTLWESSKNYINLKTKDIQYTGNQAEQEWEMYKEGNIESAKFGAAAGLLNSTVVGKVVNYTMKTFEKPVLKATQKVSKLFEKNSTVSGTYLMKTYLTNQKPGFLAQSAGVLAEVSGFTLYETANEVAKELMVTDENGERHLPKELTEEGLTSFLWERFKGQASMLGEIKAISKLIFMHKGAVNIRNQMMEENLRKCETINNLKIKKSEINGREVFEIKYANGTREVANSVDEAIAKCHVIMQFDMIMNNANEINTKENVDEVNVQKDPLNPNLSNKPQGLTTQEDVLIKKARTENPVESVAGKVKQQWQSADLQTKVKDEPVDLFNLDLDAGLRESSKKVNDEVTNLILTGQLKWKLTQHYRELGSASKDIAKKHNSDIKKLAKDCGNDKQQFAEGVVKILAEEMGLKGLKPKIEFIEMQNSDGLADWTTGTIKINKNTNNAKKLVEILSHEFTHMLQYRDILAQYGEQGLREIVMNDKSIPDQFKEAEIKEILESPFTARLLENYNNLKYSEEGSLNEYLRRIYKDEFANPINPDAYMKGYVDQATEREAYRLGSEQLGNNFNGLENTYVGEGNWKVEQGEIKDINGQKFRINSDGTITRLNNGSLPAGIAEGGMSDAEFYTKGIDLCKRSDGSISPAAEALLKSLRDSELENTSYDVNNSKLEDFNTMSRDYKNNLLSEEMLGYAKEFVDCIPKGKDKYLTQSTEYSINNLITNLLDYAKPGERQEIVNAAKRLFSNSSVRNSVVDDIISACVEGNYNEGYTFNKNVFERIYATFEKKIKNRESEPDQSYSLMISEIAKNGIYYEKDANGGYIKCFDDIGFKIGMILPEADPYGHYVHYDLTKDRNTGEVNLHNIDRNTQSYIIRKTEENYFQAQKERSEYNWRTEKHETKIEYDEYAEPLKRLCMVDGKLDVQNCFAVDYMINDLGLDKSKVVKILENYRNQDGILDMTMLRLIKNEREDYHKVGVLNTLQKLEQDNSFLYNENGNVNEEIFQNLKNAPITRSMTIRISDYFWHDNYNYDISKHYMTDGKIDFQKLKTVESELANIVGMLGIKCDNAYERCTVSNLYNTIKANPDDASKILEAAKKGGMFALGKASDKNGKGVDLDELYYYASLPDDLYKLIKNKSWLIPFVKGEPATNDVDWYIKNDLKPQDKVILDKYGINIDYVMSSRKNQFNRKSEVSQEAQNQLEHTIDTLDRTLSNADVSSGIELEYSRAQFERDLIAAVKDLPQVRANYILNSFGLTLRNGKIEGIITKPQMDAPQNLANIEQEIKQCIEKFQNNRVLNQDPSLNAVYDSLTKDFPEFAMLVGKVGSDGQRVDVTVLRQMQALINNSQYQKLSPEEQKMAKLTLMLRAFDEVDSTSKIIEKSFTTDNDGRAVNVSHKRYKNGDFAWAILERFNLTDAEKYAVTDLVAHSGWSLVFDGGVVDIGLAREYKPEWIKRNGVKRYPEINPENNANKVAVNTRFGTLELSKLIEDIINPNNNVDIKSIEAAQKRVYQNMQIVNSVSAKDLEPYWETQIIDGVECQVIDLRKTKLPDDFYLMGHFTEHGVEHLYNLLNNKNDKVFFSNSLLKANSASTFAGRTEGIISEFDNRNVAETHCYNIDSGFGKSYNDFVLTMSGKGGYHDVANIVKKNLGLTNEEYGALIEQIVDKRFNELDDYYNINGRYLSKQEIVDAHNAAYENLLRSQGEQNEITILNQTPIAFVYSASNTYGVCPFSMKDSPLRRVIIFP